jgi:hypothetical protein
MCIRACSVKDLAVHVRALMSFAESVVTIQCTNCGVKCGLKGNVIVQGDLTYVGSAGSSRLELAS